MVIANVGARFMPFSSLKIDPRKRLHLLPDVFILVLFFFKLMSTWDFPGGPVAKTLNSQCRGPGFDPWSGN